MIKRIKDLPKLDRPREKLIHKGVQALSEFELLEVLIGSGNAQMSVGQLAAQVQKIIARKADSFDYNDLVAVKGFSTAKATQLLAAFELAKRYVIRGDMPLTDTKDYIVALGDIASKKQEYLVCLSLDGARRLIARRVVTIGILDSVMVHPREVFTDAIADRAAAVVIGHNHPSGSVDPSPFDVSFTQQLVAAAQIIGIELIDHLIVSPRGHYSFRESGMF